MTTFKVAQNDQGKCYAAFIAKSCMWCIYVSTRSLIHYER